MKDSYHLRDELSITVMAFLSPNVVDGSDANEWWLNRIATQTGIARGKGWGTKLLELVIAEADANQATLILGVEPDEHDGTRYFQRLVRWYTRHGFVRAGKHRVSRWNNVMIRRPR